MQLTLFQYAIWPVLFFVNSSTRFGIDSSSFRHSWAIFSSRNHMSIITSMMQSFLCSLVFTILHKFSIGFKSGELPGQARTLIPFSSNNFFTFLQNDKESNLVEKYLLQLETSVPFLLTVFVSPIHCIIPHSSSL